MAIQTFYATGRRKNATARVWLSAEGGDPQVNARPALDHLRRATLVMQALEPLEVVGLAGQLTVKAKCTGGGLTGHAGAIRQGVARALLHYNPELRQTLRRAGFLTRDPRVKERKKYGRKRARRGFQFSKR